MIVGLQPTSGQRFVASTDWKGYLAILEAFDERRVKITYDEGALELLSPSPSHEQIKKLLARIVEDAAFELGVDCSGGGSTTFRRKALEKGLEPDECYYIGRGPLSGIGADLPDETEYPAPDLALEIEITCSALNRIGIFRALGVPEIWRYTAQHKAIILSLGPEGYTEVKTSRYFPVLSPDRISYFVQRGLEVTSLELIKELRAWLAEQRA
jgi:Uma2 family endonuclease